MLSAVLDSMDKAAHSAALEKTVANTTHLVSWMSQIHRKYQCSRNELACRRFCQAPFHIPAPWSVRNSKNAVFWVLALWGYRLAKPKQPLFLNRGSLSKGCLWRSPHNRKEECKLGGQVRQLNWYFLYSQAVPWSYAKTAAKVYSVIYNLSLNIICTWLGSNASWSWLL